MELRELLTDIDHNLISGDSSVQVSGVSYDSRLSGPGDLFVALPSASHNPEHGVAHNLKSAFTAGVRSFVINQADQPAAAPLLLDDAASEDTVTVLTVADTRQALAMISRRWFGFPERELKVVALTGTKGKTTISYMLADMADAAGVPLGLIGSNGIIFGDEHLKLPNTTPESYEIHKTLRLMADAHMAVAVIETTSQGFKLHRTDGLEFDLGVYTNISNDHVSPTEHPTFEDYFACKEQIFDQAKLCFVNRDAAMFDQIVAAANPSCTIATYGETDAADIWADGVTAATTVGDMTTSFNCHWASTNESGGLGATTLAPYDAAGLATPATPGSPTTTDNAGTATPATPVSIPFTANHPGTPGALGTTATEPGAPGASGSPTTTETDHSGTATEPTAPATPVSIPFTMSLPGEFNVSNALAAISVGRALGWPIEALQRGLKSTQVPGRMELVAVPAPFTVMIDFAHNGLSMTELVKAARAHHPKRLLTVFGLEGNRSHDRRFESGRVLGREFDQIILADASPRTDDPDQIIADIASGIVEAGGQGKYQIIRDRHQAIPAILDLAQPGDLVLLIGKGNVPYEEVMGVNHPLSERVIVEDYFAGKCTQSSKTA